MSHTSPLGLPDAARRFGVSIRALRDAIRAGRIPAPPTLSAVARLPAEWVGSVEQALQESPEALERTAPPKIPPFARYEGTSAWRKYPKRVREYARFRASQA